MIEFTRKLNDEFGAIDIYLFDQLLKGRVPSGAKVFDAGCGGGRNAQYLLRNGCEVYGADENPHAIAAAQRLAKQYAPDQPADNFRTESIENHSFEDGFAQLVICNAVLHFSRDEEQFHAILNGAWRALAPGGVFFCRVASTIGCESIVQPEPGGPPRRFRLPDGSRLLLVDEPMLRAVGASLGARLLEPIKTTLVAGTRSMTTWVLTR